MTVVTVSVAVSTDDGNVGRESSGTEYPPTGLLYVTTSGPPAEASTSLMVRKYHPSWAEVSIGFCRFDTGSVIPDNATILSSKLKLFHSAASGATNRDICISYYDPANWPLGTEDFSMSSAPLDNAARLPIANLTVGQTVEIPLSNLSNISKTGYTAFRMEVDGGDPGATSYTRHFAEVDHLTNPAPELEITYIIQTPISLDASLPVTGAVTAQKSSPRLVAGSLNTNPVLAFVKSKFFSLPGSVTLTSVIRRGLSRTLVGTLNTNPVIARVAKKFLTLAASVTSTVAMSRRLGKTIAVTLNTNPVQSFVKSKFITLAATVTNTISLTRRVTYYKTLAAGATMTPAMTRRNTAYKTLAASATLAAQVQMIRIGRISLQSNLPLTNIVARKVNAPLNSVITLAGAIQAQKLGPGFSQITLAAGLQLQVAIVKTTLVKKVISAALFLDTVLRKDQFAPDDGAEDWLIDAKSLDTPQLDAAQLQAPVLERTRL